MIEKLERHTRVEKGLTQDIKISCPPVQSEIVSKINELVDVVNRLEESVQGVVNNSIADGARIQGLKEKLDAVVNMVNIHESEIDKLQMKVEPEKCETFVSIDKVLKKAQKAEPKTPADPYAEQRKWIGKLCRFWDGKEEEKVFGILTTIDSDCGLSDMCPYWNDTTKNWFEHCEPVKDDIIYKGGDNDSSAN